jgi:fatty-acyl-CoA synthase
MNNMLYASGTSYEYPLIIKKLFSAMTRYFPSQTIVYRDRAVFTYTELARRINRLAGALSALGVQKGDVVGIIDYNSHRFLESFFAVPMMGATIATLNWRLGIDELGHTISHASPRVLLVHEDFSDLVRKTGSALEKVEHLVIIRDSDGQAGRSGNGTVEYEDILGRAPETYTFSDFDENTPAALYYTAGTTGLPKGVTFTHRQIVLQTLTLALSLGSYSSKIRFTSRDVFIPLVPMWNEHGWGLPFLATIIGAQQIYSGKYNTENLLHLFGRYKITFSVCYPTALHLILEHPLSKDLDFSSCKVIVTGASITEKLAAAALARGISVTSAFCLAEGGALVSMSHLKGGLDRGMAGKKAGIICSAGIPAPLVEVGIVDSAGELRKSSDSTPGEVVIRSPWLTRAYHRDSEKTRNLWKKGWLYSGDVGFIDKHGYLRITERVKRLTKSGGEWISHLKIENLVRRIKGVKDAAVVSVPDDVWGERPAVIVVIDKSCKGTVDPGQIERAMQSFAETGELPRYALPDRYVIVDEIPRTGVHKIDVRMIRERYGHLLAPAEGKP